MIYYVYVLQFKNDKKMYKGYTKNLKLRLEEHKSYLTRWKNGNIQKLKREKWQSGTGL